MDSSQIRTEARNLMSNQFGMLVLIMLIYWVMMSAAGSLLFVGYLVVYGPLSLGLAAVLLKVIEGQKIRLEEFFCGFQDFSRSFVLGLLISLYVFLWSLLLFIPGIVAAFSYSMAFFILQENPHLNERQAIEASKQMMYGHKWRLFDLCVSFLGWFLLCVISFGIALIYVLPYFHVALAVFYEDLKHSEGVIIQ